MQKILVIDDDRQVQATLRKMLEREGYAVMLAVNGSQGIKSYRENRVDLVLTDLLMPEKDGLQTIRELRRLNGDARIIAFSGGGRVDKQTHLSVAGHFGAQKTLTKPVARRELLAAVKELLNT